MILKVESFLLNAQVKASESAMGVSIMRSFRALITSVFPLGVFGQAQSTLSII